MYSGVYFIFRGGVIMRGRPITIVEPLDDWILKVTFDTGNSVTIDMEPSLSIFRFGVLQDINIWETGDTDGGFIHWYKNGIPVVELAYNEIMKMTLGESY